VTLPGGSLLAIKQLTDRLAPAPVPGQQVRIGWGLDYTVVLPAGATGT
jgi:hypothetical protein